MILPAIARLASKSDYTKELVEILGDCLRLWDTPMKEDERWCSMYTTIFRDAMGIILEPVPDCDMYTSDETT